MGYETLRQRVLRENDLMDTIDFFMKDDGEVYYTDRHALVYAGYNYDPFARDPLTIKLGVKLGLDLLRHGSAQKTLVTSLLVSDPFLAVDEEWLLGRENHAPPTVVICLAKTQAAIQAGWLRGYATRPRPRPGCGPVRHVDVVPSGV